MGEGNNGSSRGHSFTIDDLRAIGRAASGDWSGATLGCS